jgi:hypothetical protein
MEYASHSLVYAEGEERGIERDILDIFIFSCLHS